MTQLTEEQAIKGIPDNLPYRIVEAMGLGLTFRSCTCGQLPCARLRPLRDALKTARREAATAMRDKCALHLQATADALDVRQETECPSGTAFNSEAALRRRIAVELQSLTVQVKPGEM